MPTISYFYGIIIKMYFQDAEHNPPHFHVIYGEYEAEFNIETAEVLEGRLPMRASRLVRKWAGIHREELLEIWNTQHFIKIKPLE